MGKETNDRRMLNQLLARLCEAINEIPDRLDEEDRAATYLLGSRIDDADPALEGMAARLEKVREIAEEALGLARDALALGRAASGDAAEARRLFEVLVGRDA